LINWQTFDWQSFSTLVTGAAAVGGAYLIGKRQLAITDRQNAILEKQVALERKRMDQDLYDRRFKIYEVTVRFIIDPVRSDNDLDQDLISDFLVASRESRFLFDQAMYDALDEIWYKVHEAKSFQRQMRHIHEDGGIQSMLNGEAQRELFAWLNKRSKSLHELFFKLNIGEDA
jgi:hypothetical protein